MLNAKTRRTFSFGFVVAAAALVNGCALDMDGTSDEPTAENEAAAKLPPDVIGTRPPIVIAPPVEHHHICYQDAPLLKQDGSISKLRFRLRCRANDASCAISGVGSGGPAGETTDLREYSPPSSAFDDSATFTFADGSTHTCTYRVGGSRATSGAVLDGYTTDASGLVTTGVWKRHSTPSQHFQAPNGQFQVVQQVQVPSDFVAVGGGAVGVPDAAFVYKSYLSGGWLAGTSSNSNPVDHDNDVYVIGMRVEGVPNLASLVNTTYGGSAPTVVPHPSSQVSLPAAFVALGGGGYGYTPPPAGNTNQWQQYLTASQPLLTSYFVGCGIRLCLRSQVTGWAIQSKDHLISGPGWTIDNIYSIPTDVTINGAPFHFEGNATSRVSAIAAQPSAVANGLPGEYALTAVGAFVDWEQGTNPQGNLIWKLQPRADIAGAEVASTEHGVASPAAITAFAAGIKLVPGHS